MVWTPPWTAGLAQARCTGIINAAGDLHGTLVIASQLDETGQCRDCATRGQEARPNFKVPDLPEPAPAQQVLTIHD